MSNKDWNPELYLKFGKERIQPSVDLVSRIDFTNPSRIIDIGCGPGNSTEILYQRWPKAKIIGIDNSEAMIKKAEQDYPNLEWKLLDAGKDVIPGKYDIVFSNATIQWIPDHYSLFKKFKDILNANGLIAIQLPLFFDMPIGKSIIQISKNQKWSDLTESVTSLFTINSTTEYYEIISSIFDSVEIWLTDYYHVMDSHSAILEMIKSTGLKPYLDKLESDIYKKEFENLVLKSIENDYPLQKNGKVLFPFKRLFLIAK